MPAGCTCTCFATTANQMVSSTHNWRMLPPAAKAQRRIPQCLICAHAALLPARREPWQDAHLGRADVEVDAEAAGGEAGHTGGRGLRLADPRHAERQHAVHHGQNRDRHVKALERQRRVAHQQHRPPARPLPRGGPRGLPGGLPGALVLQNTLWGNPF